MNHSRQAAGRRWWLVGAVRFLMVLALAAWLGGILFLGAVAAPAIFKVARAHQAGAIAPLMVAAMLGRFNVVTYGCAFALVAGWALEHGLGAVGRGERRLWQAQGVGSVLLALLALYLGGVLMPRLNALHAQIPPPSAMPVATLQAREGTPPVPLTGEKAALKAEFDNGHRQYQQLAMCNWWLGVGVLLLLTARWLRASKAALAVNEDGEPSGSRERRATLISS